MLPMTFKTMALIGLHLLRKQTLLDLTGSSLCRPDACQEEGTEYTILHSGIQTVFS